MGLSIVETVLKMRLRPSKAKDTPKSQLLPNADIGHGNMIANHLLKSFSTPPRSISGSDGESPSHGDVQSTPPTSLDETRLEGEFDVPKPPNLSPASVGASGPKQSLPRNVYRPHQYTLLPPTLELAPMPSQTLEIVPTQRKDSSTITGPRSRNQNPTAHEPKDFDLRPPQLRRHSATVEGISDSLFGESHLRYILDNRKLRLAFSTFLNQCRPSLVLPFVQYLENQKALAAVGYANAIAASQKALPGTITLCAAATISSQFRSNGQTAFDTLLAEALPAYLTHELTKEVSRYQMDHVSNANAPTTNPGVDGLSGVFCLTDPNLKDQPIIYASEEFFKLTQYGRDYVIGRNCRFLQGPATKRSSIDRLRNALKTGREVRELLLNYRRDGSPFLNLMLVAPLHDDRGEVKYVLGAQIDVTELVTDMPTLSASIAWRKGSASGASGQSSQFAHLKPPVEKDSAPEKLKELSALLSAEEVATLTRDSNYCHSRDISDPFLDRAVSPTTTDRPLCRAHLSHDDMGVSSALPGRNTTIKPPALSLEQGLLGVYEGYLLVRPSQSLPILFASAALQKSVGHRQLQQSPLFSHITASSARLASIKEAFVQGLPSTSRIYWRCAAASFNSPTTGVGWDHRGILETIPSTSPDKRIPSRKLEMRWMKATPLVGGDDSIGVWMIVIV